MVFVRDVQLLKQSMGLWRLSQEVNQIRENVEELDDVGRVLQLLLLFLFVFIFFLMYRQFEMLIEDLQLCSDLLLVSS